MDQGTGLPMPIANDILSRTVKWGTTHMGDVFNKHLTDMKIMLEALQPQTNERVWLQEQIASYEAFVSFMSDKEPPKTTG